MPACFAFQVQVTPKLELNLCTDSCTSFVCIGLYIYRIGWNESRNHLCKDGTSMTRFWLFIFCHVFHPSTCDLEAFHVRKKRKIYAMFIYDLFHTVLELPFLGLYPMVFCAYVLASVMILKKPMLCKELALNESLQ